VKFDTGGTKGLQDVAVPIVCEELRNRVEVSLVPTLVHESLYDLPVVCGLRVL